MREDNVIIRNEDSSQRRLMIGAPTTGNVRMEWVMARFGQIIPCNWSQTISMQWMNQYSPFDFQVADARNVICHNLLEQDHEWLFFIDHDVVLPPDTFIKVNEVMIHRKVPVWSGLYFTKSVPSEPLIYRGRGNGYYPDWKLGEKVWVDGVPMGCTLIHRTIIEELAKISRDYNPGGNFGLIKEIFITPAKVWYDPQARVHFAATGTEDLDWCTRIMKEGIIEKAGWADNIPDLKNPFLMDTSVFCKHIELDGIQYPARGEEQQFMAKEQGDE